MAQESRLSITIDSRTAEQRAKDLAAVLDAATKAGINVTASADKAGKAAAGAGSKFSKAGRDAKSGASGVDKFGKSLKDARSAAMSLRGALTGAFVGVSVAGTISKIISETRKAEEEQAQLAAVLKSTGEAAGFTQEKLNEMAGAMSLISTVSDGEITQAQTTLLAFTGIAGNQFPKALQAAIDMATRTGMSVVSAAETIGRALDVPSEGLAALTRQGFRFTEEQKKLAKQLEETGRTAQAQSIILSALEESYGGAAQAARDTFGGSIIGLKNQLNSLLTGGDGSLSEATAEINKLTNTLSGESARQAFADFVRGITSAANAVAGLITQFAEGMRYSDGFFDALVKYGLTDPFKTPSEQLARINEQLGILNKDTKGLVKSIKDGSTSIFDVDPVALGGEERARKIRGLLQEQQYWQRQLERDEAKVFRSYLGTGETGGAPAISSNKVTPSSGIGGAGGGTTKATSELDRYLKSLREQAATLEMTELEAAKYRVGLMQGAEWQKKEALAILESNHAYRENFAVKREQRNLENEISIFRAQQDLTVSGLGMGDRRRQELEQEYQIREEFARRRRELDEAQESESTRISDEAYKRRIDSLRSAEEQKIAIVRETAARRQIVEQNWVTGASRAWDNYVDRARNVAGQAEAAFTGLYDGLTNEASNWVMGMEANFKDVLRSFLSMLIQMEIRAAASTLFSSIGGGAGGFIAAAASSLFGGGRAKGGPVSAGRMYEVNEDGTPELLNVGKRQFLMMGAESGHVTPLAGSASAGSATQQASSAPIVNIYFSESGIKSDAPTGLEHFGAEIARFVDARFKELEIHSYRQGGTAWAMGR